MRCLVVDDDFETRHILSNILHPYADIDVAVDGEECVTAFNAALRKGNPYDLVLLDILMPNMNGQAALRELREIEKEHNVPPQDEAKVVMVSGLDNNEEVNDAFFLGEATSYIVKPIDRKVLLREIESLGLPLRPRAGAMESVF